MEIAPPFPFPVGRGRESSPHDTEGISFRQVGEKHAGTDSPAVLRLLGIIIVIHLPQRGGISSLHTKFLNGGATSKKHHKISANINQNKI